MSNSSNTSQSGIPVGDIQFFDNYLIPDGFDAANYTLTITQTLSSNGSAVNSDPLTTTQQFVVSGPQFALDPNAVLNMYPPANSTGNYGAVLPHIVLTDPLLAWERAMSQPGLPWVALMVFNEDELEQGDNALTRAFSSSVGDYLSKKNGTLPGASTLLVPSIEKALDVSDSNRCQYIRFSTQLFSSVMPYLNELPYLSHVRQVNTGNRSMDGINETGIYSVTASNRFASAPHANGKPIKSIVHLVSLEAIDQYLSKGASFGAYTDVALISLASWVFYTLPDISEDFSQLANNLTNYESSGGTVDPTRLWLKLPAAVSGSDAASTEIANRITNGYAPLAYHTRSGENTFAWYRGPLAPVLPAALSNGPPFFSADAALIYDKVNGVFDVSLASAWEAGREAALADTYFAQKLLDLRRKANQLTDLFQYKLASDHFSQTQINDIESTTTVQQMFLNLLTPQLIRDLGATAESNYPSPPAPPAPSSTDPVQDLQNFMGSPDVQQKILDLIADDLAPVAEWLARLMLLYPFPFNKLVANAQMLPVESLRFFYIDQNWISAAVDGAMSLGLDSSRQTFFSQVTKGLIYDAAMQALATTRDKLLGIDVGPDPQVPSPTIMSGFVMRSGIVTGWPNLAIKPSDENDNSLKILRLDHLADNVLFCIFDGVPNNIEFSQPQESLGFGVDDDGNVVIRDVANAATLGQQIKLVQVRDMSQPPKNQMCMRTLGGTVLNIDPTDPAGLYATLGKAVALPSGVSAIGPAIFAIQMIKSAEAFIINNKTS